MSIDGALDPLVKYITEPVSSSLDLTDQYKEHYPEHTQYADEVLAEIKAFGGHTFVNVFRGGGPRYREIVEDVADKLGVDKGGDRRTVVEMEIDIIRKLLKDALDSAEGQAREDIEQALKEAGLDARDLSAFVSGGTAAALIAARLSGFALYRVSLIVANAVAKHVLGHGLRLAANAALVRSLSVLTGPIGWVITGLWTLLDVAGPAYRVTVPCVIHVAMLRQKYLAEDRAPSPLV